MSAAFARTRLGIRGWIYGAIGAMTALLVLFSVIGGVLLYRSSQASDTLLNRIAPARTALVDMRDALVDEETGVRGYLLTGQRDFLQPYAQGEAQEAADAGEISTLLAGHAAALADLAAVRRAVGAWHAGYAAPLIADASAGRPVTDTRLTASKASFDRLRDLFTATQNEMDAERTVDLANLEHVNRIRDGAFAAMLAAFLLTAGLIAALIQVAVLRPLTLLRRQAEAVKEGTFDAPITATGPRDIRELGDALGAMRTRLTRALTAAERQHAALDDQTRLLDAQASELRRSNEELEQFAYVASHDLQEPLRKVASFCQLIEKRYGDALDARGKQYIDYAVDGAKRMQILINDLLAFSRVGRLAGRHERVELQAVLGGAVDGLQVAVDESGAVIRVADGPLPAVTGDPTLLGMLLQNLVGNSLKFRTPGRPPEIDLAWEPDPAREGFVRLSLTDNGIGIPAEFAEKVFVIFQRLHGREAYPGTGIGLALCKKIVEYHGGRIGIDPDRASGTRFTFTLPAAESVAEPEAESVAEPATEPVTEPAPELATESVAEPPAEPVNESVPEPAAVPGAPGVPASPNPSPGAEPSPMERNSEQ